MTPRRAVSQELSQERILTVATEMFIKEGYHSLSMRKIAQELGYSHGALYYHYKDKAELFGEIVVRDFRRLMKVLVQTLFQIPNPELTMVENVFVEYIRFGFENKRQYELMFLLDVHSAVEEKNLSYQKFADTVMQLIGSRRGEKDAARVISFSVFLSLHGFVAYYLYTDIVFNDIQPIAHAHAKLLYQGLLAMLDE